MKVCRYFILREKEYGELNVSVWAALESIEVRIRFRVRDTQVCVTHLNRLSSRKRVAHRRQQPQIRLGGEFVAVALFLVCTHRWRTFAVRRVTRLLADAVQ